MPEVWLLWFANLTVCRKLSALAQNNQSPKKKKKGVTLKTSKYTWL